jgi:hypothetical protein
MKKRLMELSLVVSPVLLVLAYLPTLILVLAFFFQHLSLLAYRFFAPVFTIAFVLFIQLNWGVLPLAVITSVLAWPLILHKKRRFCLLILLFIPTVINLLFTYF